MIEKTQFKPAPQGLARVSIVDRLTELLRKRILRGEWKEGEQLRQESIADEYQVSRMPVREALRQLEMEGLIVFQNNKGAEVSRLSIIDIDELFDLRANLECLMIGIAAPNAQVETYERAEKALEDLNAAYLEGDTHSGGELNWVFHESLYLPAQKPHTLSIIRNINYHTDRYVRVHLMLKENSVSQATLEHKEILEAYKTKDPRAARASLKTHILRAKRDLLAAAERLHSED